MKKYYYSVIFLSIWLLVNNSFVFSKNMSNYRLNKLVDKSINASLVALSNSVNEIKDYNLYPNQGTKEFKWQLRTSSDWTSGFYPGTLWYAYELSKDARFKNWAEKWTIGIEKEKFNKFSHDLGFQFYCSFGNGLRLAPEDISTSKYKEIMLAAAETLSSRFITTIGMFPSDFDHNKDLYPNTIPVIVDIMMNLEFMLWAAENKGDTKMKEKCIMHAVKTNKDFIKPDGGTYHVVRYDNKTAAVVHKGQLQGDVDSSTWSRGQAWMVYGNTVMYRYTRNPEFLKKAMLLADYFISHLPTDKIANWDFQSKLDHRDASASAIVCSSLFELQKYVRSKNKQRYYLSEAKAILAALCQPPYFTEGEGTNCLLYNSTQYFHRTKNTDVPCVFADYYFMEALTRYKALKSRN